MNLTVIWHFLLGVCEVIHIFIWGRGGKKTPLQQLCWKYYTQQ